ncbi:MAG: hypothetical protein RR346_00885 [Bacteroidales bacterium]
MKTNKIIYTFLIGSCLTSMTLSCRSDEPEPEKVTSPTEEALYYITGRVESGGVALPNAKVVAEGLPAVTTGNDGTYLISTNSKNKTYVLTFSATNYVTAKGQVTLPDNMAGHGAIMLNANLGKSNPAIPVPAGASATISYPTDRSSIQIPTGATSTAQNISITTASPLVGGGQVSLDVVCSPIGLKFSKPVTLNVRNISSSSNIAVVEPMLRIESSSTKANAFMTKAPIYTWTDLGVMTFDPATNTYKAPVNELGIYMVEPKYETSSRLLTTNQINTQTQVSNCGNISALRGQTIDVKQKTGWEFPVDPEIIIQRAIPSITPTEKTDLANIFHSIAQKYVGTAEGVYTLNRTETVDVSGNSILTYTNKPRITEGTLIFPILYKGNRVDITIAANLYLGADITFNEVSCDNHSGGSGN